MLFSYVIAHLTNHALGLVSVNVAEEGLRVAVGFWRSLPGSVLLYSAAAVHLALALDAFYERRTLRMPTPEALRIHIRPELGTAVAPLFSAQSDTSTLRTYHQVRRYDAEDITISYDAKRCVGAEECVRGLPRVFDPSRRIWVDATQANAEEIANIVQRCPTGALHFRRRGGGVQERAPGHNEVRITPNGPLYFWGELEIHTPTAVIKETRAALCRCGASRNKPFCDSSHKAIAFCPQDEGAITATGGETEGGLLRVMPATNGPCVVEGSLTLVSNDGLTRSPCGPRVAFCRCGQSRTMPFCDGSHVKAGFRDIGVCFRARKAR